MIFKTTWNFQFKSSVDRLTQNSAARRPENLPPEEVVGNILTRSVEYVRDKKNLIASNYIKVRNCTYLIITFENSRRGNEVSRLKRIHIEEALMGVWGSNLGSGDILACITGKNSRNLIQVNISEEIIDSVKFLLDGPIRSQSGIRDTNPYLFPSLHSDSKISGWHAGREVFRMLNVDHCGINATKIRHLVSTTLGPSMN